MKPRVRRARKPHWCDTGGRYEIGTGAYYLEGASFPGDDIGAADGCGHPVRLRECLDCALRYGRDYLFP